MSLWSKLGLADAESVLALQQELKELKFENEKLQQENLQQLRTSVQSQVAEIQQMLAHISRSYWFRWRNPGKNIRQSLLQWLPGRSGTAV